MSECVSEQNSGTQGNSGGISGLMALIFSADSAVLMDSGVVDGLIVDNSWTRKQFNFLYYFGTI